MKEVSIHEAKTHLSRLLQEVEAGETILLKRGNIPVARLVPLDKPRTVRAWPQFEGKIRVADDFDAALPADILHHFQP